MFDWLKKQKEKDSHVTTIHTRPIETTTVAVEKNSKKVEKRNKKRTMNQIDEEILNLLRLSQNSIPTYKIAKTLNLDNRSALNHLEKLEFDDLVKSHKRGLYGKWRYWKIKR